MQRCHKRMSTFHQYLNDKESTESSHILNMYDKLLNVIHAKMPQADVYVSSIFKRRDAKYDSFVTELNNHIEKFSEDLKWISFIDHSNINGSLMYDPKHLSKPGFYVMLTNVRYVMFKILPSFRKHNNYKRGKYPPKRHVLP